MYVPYSQEEKNTDRWQEQNGITFQVTYGTPQLNSLRIQRGKRRIGVIKKNFCLNLPEIDADGCNGCLRQRSVTESVY